MQTYFMTSAVLVIDADQNILLKKDPNRGWELPGGNLDDGESIMTCAVREVKEETGMDVEIVKLCGMTHEVENRRCTVFWIARPVGGQLRTCAESLDVGFFGKQEALSLIERDDFRNEVAKCLDFDHHPFYIEN
jgi:ADP-ribose pyrophosphatase